MLRIELWIGNDLNFHYKITLLYFNELWDPLHTDYSIIKPYTPILVRLRKIKYTLYVSVTELGRTHGPEPLGPISVTVPDTKSPPTSEDPRSGLLTTSAGRRAPKRPRSPPEPSRSLDAPGALSSASSGSAEPRSVSPVYPSNSPLPFPPNPAFFSLFLNAPLLQPSQWLYSQLYPHHPYNHFPFRQPPPEDSSDSRKTPPTSPSPVRTKTPSTPPPSSAPEAKNTSRSSDVWRPY